MSKDVKTLRVVDVDAVPVYAVNTEDAASFVGLSVKTLANMRSDGTGPKYLKVGSKVLYRVRDLENWIDSYC
ncbi:helix-turn-helix transcriptional regulator [Corynebacterium sp. ACRQP]|uniref:helix-turn-helix transcriptional regulator n=1 Tax=Corynebacterium sp. ACRQP TaxID=2918195 RepID=UPI00351D2781